MKAEIIADVASLKKRVEALYQQAPTDDDRYRAQRMLSAVMMLETDAEKLSEPGG